MKKYITISFLFFLLLSNSSCNKFLEQPIYNNVGTNDIFQDFEGVRTTLVGCYDNLKSFDYYLRDLTVYPEVTGGNIKYSKLSNVVQFLSFNFANDILNNDMKSFYGTAYKNIYAANNIIQYINKALDATDFQKNKMLADAYAIRALAHFDLVRVFAQPYNYTTTASHSGIVIKTTNVAVTTPSPATNTVKEVYKQILTDIDTSLARYTNSVDIYTTGTAKTWLSTDAVLALRARVCLYMQDWDGVIAACNTLINAGKYPLLSNSQYVNSWVGKVISSESIFELAYGTRAGGSLGDYFNPRVSLTGQFATTNDLLNLYAVTDVRGKNYMYKDTVFSGFTYTFNAKYRGTSDSANNIKVFRASELYLSRAEAYAQKNQLINALQDLNTIRKRANTSAASFVSSDQTTILNEILTERRRELCFEGHLFFDLARNKKDLVRVDCISSNANFTYPNNFYACPIPVTN